ncbi:hypothetical protein [Virgisporangium aurantiacum]|uniref:Lipoprotein LprG n=1 Tax=Virgisporangium aurantiacum TaxID=175570 RepID=A0A8J4E2Y9_9ACTN|nr:hypothetical protein [Virgisporangium aurantiacum]GIJ59499.1 hypothetical protein Vau01_070150 [Virgisporangium aurantiacum]
MRVIRMFAALITALALVGGCGSRGVVSSTPRSPADPKEQLLAGIKALNSATFRIAGSSTLNSVSSTSEGVADPGRRAMRLTQSASAAAGKATKTDVVVLGTDVYLRFDVPALPGVPSGRWAHIDGRRLTSFRAVGVGGPDDLSGKLALVSALTSIERTGPDELRGTVDLSTGGSVLPEVAGALGDGLKNAQWQARFGPQGRLTWVSVTVPASGGIPAITTDTTYSGFGEPVVVDRPSAGDIVEAPENVYKLLGQ